eukprot:11268284-Prorocentrum_lima.AAC.1
MCTALPVSRIRPWSWQQHADALLATSGMCRSMRQTPEFLSVVRSSTRSSILGLSRVTTHEFPLYLSAG